MKKVIKLAFYLVPFLMLGQAKTITDSDFISILETSNKPFVVDFYATWCGPCKRMEPILDKLANEYKGLIDFYRLDVDKNQSDDALDIEAIPTFYFFNEGNVAFIKEGAISKEDFIFLIKYAFDIYIPDSVSTSNSSDSPNEFSDEEIQAKWDNWKSLNSLAWHGYQKHNEPEVLSKCIKLAIRSIELNENYYNVDTYAALLYKTNEHSKALKQAKRAIELAIKDDLDYSSTTILINNIIEKL